MHRSACYISSMPKMERDQAYRFGIHILVEPVSQSLSLLPYLQSKNNFVEGLSPGEGNGNPLQCSCLENSMDGGAWWVQSMGLPRVGHD